MTKTSLCSACCFLLLAFLSTAAADCENTEQLFPRDDNINCSAIYFDKVDNTVCILPCYVRVVALLPLRPRVDWERARSPENTTTYLPLKDKHWFASEGIYFHDSDDDNDGFNNCNLVANGTLGSYYYDCSLRLKSCSLIHLQDKLHRAFKYRCKVTAEHCADSVVNQCARLPIVETPGSLCYPPIPREFTANATRGDVVLGWNLLTRSPECTWVTIRVQPIAYRTYQDYTILEAVQSRGFMDSEIVPWRNKTEYVFPLVDDSWYYTFTLTVRYFDEKSTVYRTRVPQTPIFFFGEQRPPSIVYPVENVVLLRKAIDSEVLIRCEAEGIPTPLVKLYFGDEHIPSETLYETPSVVRKTLRVTPDSVGNYYCVAIGIIVPPEGGTKIISLHKLIVIEAMQVVDEPFEELVCVPHGDTVCQSYFSTYSVLINTSAISFHAKVESSVGTLLQIKNVSDSVPVSRCAELAMAMVCHSAYPFCSHVSHEPRAICRSTCDAFGSGGACEGVLDWSADPEIFQLMVSNCDERVAPAGSAPECIHVPLVRQQVPPETSWCSRGDGQSYAGNVLTTSSGRYCQEWASSQPHLHPRFPAETLHRAVRHCRNPGGRGERPWCYTSEHNTRWEYCDVPQCTTCEPYSGSFCAHLPGYDFSNSSIFVDRHESQWDEDGQSRAENWMLNTYLRVVNGVQLPAGCIDGLKELMCHSALPFCSSQDPVGPSPLCPSHCQLVELLRVCPHDMLSAIQREMQHSRHSFFQAACEGPPGSGGAGNTAECVPVEIELEMELFASLGSESLVTGLTNGDSSTAPAKPSTEPVRTISSTTVGVISVVGVLGIVLIFFSIFLTLAVALYLLRKHKKELPPSDLPVQKLRQGREWDYVINETYARVGAIPPKIKDAVAGFPQFDKSSFKYIRQLGQGNFGIVFYAKAEGIISDDEKVTEVAVKTLKDDEHSVEAMEDFVREAKLMFSFDHPNIVKILGVCIEDMPCYLVFEYMDRGDLAQFLRTNASSLQRHVMDPTNGRLHSSTESTLSDDPASLNVDQLTDICMQIAAGMIYLADNNHVHRDLACRNCLVKSCDWEQTSCGLSIKIGDFGMSQNLYSADYYRVRGQAVLPIRWMSPEAVIYGKFSTLSDVWSFGVVMWEVFSFAMQPYYGTSNEEVTEAIRRHKILLRPEACPNRYYEIMKSCWAHDAKERPSFTELGNILHKFCSSISSSNMSPSQSCSDLESDAFEENSACEDA